MLVIDSHNEKAVAKLRELNEKGFSRIVILGKPWVGKTYLARSLVGHDYFIDEPTFKQHVVAGNARLRPPEKWAESVKYYPLEALAKYPSVIYDDYGSAESSATYIEKTLYWLNERAKPWKKTVITSNLSLEEIHERDARIASRLLEDALVLILGGDDRRKLNTKLFNC